MTKPILKGPKVAGEDEIEGALTGAREVHVRLRDGRDFVATVAKRLRADHAVLRPWGTTVALEVAVKDVAAISVVTGIGWEQAREIAAAQRERFT